MNEQRSLIPPEPPPPDARSGECWVCRIPLRAIENGWGQTIARQCPRCFRLTPTGKKQPIKAPKK